MRASRIETCCRIYLASIFAVLGVTVTFGPRAAGAQAPIAVLDTPPAAAAELAAEPDGTTPLALASLVGFAGTGALVLADEAPAAGPIVAADPEQNIGAYLGRLFDAVKSGDWILVAALSVIGLTWGLRKWGARLIPWLGTDRGGVVVAGASAFSLGIANALLAGRPVDASLVVTAVEVALVAMGGWAGIRKLLGISNASST